MKVLLRIVCVLLISPVLIAVAVAYLCFLALDLFAAAGIYGLSGKWEEPVSFDMARQFTTNLTRRDL